jgi:hypothetical protein
MDLTCPLEDAVESTPRVRSVAWQRWIFPDLALVFAVVALLRCLLMFDGAGQSFTDSDTGWHIRTGESIIAGGGLPRTDPYSFMRSGEPWFAWEWGSDVIMGALHMAGGLPLVAGFYGFAVALCAWLWMRLCWKTGANFLLAAAAAPVALTAMMLHYHARPHILGWVLLLCAVTYAESHGRSLVAVACASALWANVHASFFLGPAVALIYATGHVLQPLLWTCEARREEAIWFVKAACVSLAATLLNPYGIELHTHTIRFLLDRELLSQIAEFQSFNFYAPGAERIVVLFAICAAGASALLARHRLPQFLLAVFFLLLALRSARVIPLLACVVLPLSIGGITDVLRGAFGVNAKLRPRLDAFLRYGDNLRQFDTRFNGAAVGVIVLCLALGFLQTPVAAARVQFSAGTFPVIAAEKVQRLPIDARLLAPDFFGGYLIYRFNGERKVYVDGRSDFYGPEYMRQYLRLIEVRPGWQETLQRMAFTHALLPNRYSLIPALEAAGWKSIYSDGVATLLEKQ